jgi:16S rRNA (guanine527-N7)-methyltransferase
METSIIIDLLRPFIDLRPSDSEEGQRSQTIVQQTQVYLNLLLKWNAKVSLTAVRKAGDVVTRHFGESFFAAKTLLPQGWSGRVIDVGSGAGFPGLPLAMFAPGVEVTLIEANNKKAVFLSEVIHALKLANVKVFRKRAEEYAEKGDLVTMRAVEKFEQSALLAAGLVCVGGRLALMIGASQVGVARRTVQGILWQEPLDVPGGHSRVLLVGAKPESRQ